MRNPADKHHFTMETSGRHLVGFWIQVLLLLQLSRLGDAASKDIVCEPITVPMCKGIGYNHTYMPNQFNHDTQDEVGLEVHQFWPLSGSVAPRTCFSSCAVCTPQYVFRTTKSLCRLAGLCARGLRGVALPSWSSMGLSGQSGWVASSCPCWATLIGFVWTGIAVRPQHYHLLSPNPLPRERHDIEPLQNLLRRINVNVSAIVETP